MPKTRKLCAYCGQPCSSKTKDHVVPRGLWEKGLRPQHLITVPACRNCNASFSEDELYFRTMLLAMLSEGQLSSNATAVVNGAFRRSISKGLNTQQLLAGSKYQAKLSEGGVYLGHYPSIQIDLARVNRVIGKIVKGFCYFKNKAPLPKTHVVAVWEGSSFWQECDSIVGQMNNFDGLGDDDFRASFLRDQNDPNRTYHLYLFYQNLSFFAATLPAAEIGIENTSAISFDQTFPLRLTK